MSHEARIVKTCSCDDFGVIETGICDYGDRYIIAPHSIIQLYGPDGLMRYSNRDPSEEMDDLNMICIRCGSIARWE